MQITICDRCGKEIQEPKRARGIRTAFHFVRFRTFDTKKDEMNENFELCAECAETLWNWLHSTQKGDAEGLKNRRILWTCTVPQLEP